MAQHARYFRLIFVFLGLIIAGQACSDDTSTSSGPATCAEGEIFIQSSQRCIRDNTNNAVDSGDDAGRSDVEPNDADPVDTGSQDTSQPDTDQDASDTRSDAGCDVGADDDSDGLDNACECSLGTDPTLADTDQDGLSDADEDANANCARDPDETDPTSDDSDLDGLNDGDEVNAGTDPLAIDTDQDGVPDPTEQASGCMDPTSADTDGDGLEDGVEDANFDGNLGTCTWTTGGGIAEPDPLACADGESNPCSTDTDGDGTPDQEELDYFRCSDAFTQQLSAPTFLTNGAGDYKVSLHSGVATQQVSGSPNVQAHVIGDSTHQYTGFIAVANSPNNTTDPALLSDELTAVVQSLYPSATRLSAGRRVTSHDNFEAVTGGLFSLPPGTDLAAARDNALNAIYGTSAGTLGHGLSAPFPGDPSTPTLMSFEILSRGAGEFVLITAFSRKDLYEDDTLATGYRVDDLVGGASLSVASRTLEADCVDYDADPRPEVDIIISFDTSGTMSDELADFVGSPGFDPNEYTFALELEDLLDNANLDWRVAVTSSICSDAKNDADLSQPYRNLWLPAGSFREEICPSAGATDPHNGELYAPGFMRSGQDLEVALESVDSTTYEYTLSMGIAAIDRALPRAAGDAYKIRPDAAVLLIVVTDEFEEYFNRKLYYYRDIDIRDGLDAQERTQLESITQPWVNFLLGADVEATVFGIYNPPGEDCPTSNDVAHGIADVVSKTGGAGGSVCQSDITNTLATVANATAGIASGLRLNGVPAPQTVEVKLGRNATGQIEDVVRGRTDGFDYDSIVNRVAFYGASVPDFGDRVIIPYLRWSDSQRTCTTDADCPAEQKLICISGVCR